MIIPELFNDYIIERTAELSRLRNSSMLTDMSELLGDKMGGTTVNMPFYKDLSGDDQLVDDTTDLAINSIATGSDVAAKLYRAQVFGATDLAADLSGSDPVGAIVDLFAEYWARQEEKILLKILSGAMAAASMSGNVLDISGLTGAAANFDADSFLDATAKLGDRQDDLAAIAVHGDTYSLMKKLDLIDFIPDSESKKIIPTYMGHLLIVDDSMPKDSVNGIYDTYIFGNGAIGFAQASPKNPVEVGRDPLINGGQDYVVNRRFFVMHPRGIKWIGTPAKATPSDSELATGTNWERVYENKNIKIVLFRHKLTQS
jgi:hypothetical protein